MKGIQLFCLFMLIISADPIGAQTVTLDHFFNREYHKNALGNEEAFHYLWTDTAASGYSNWGDIWLKHGAKIQTLEQAPTTENLKGSSIYIIVDPDTKRETNKPNYIQPNHIKEIDAWVKNGGVLVMLANDSSNVELEHFNKLAQVFGIQFNDVSYRKVLGDDFEMGAFYIPANHTLFKTAHKIYMKELATLRINSSASALLKDGKEVIIATSKYGKGIVLAIGDPFIYNEYCNGRLPKDFENDKAAGDLSTWLIEKTKVNQ